MSIFSLVRRPLLSFAFGGVLLFSAGCDDKAPEKKAAVVEVPKGAATPIDGRIKITVENEDYNPLAVQVKANEEVVLEFTRVSSSPCGERVMVPDHDIDVELPLNKAVDVKITPKKAGTLAFMCGMKMMKGTIIVQ
ncbi:MAG: hypothetical protein GY822_11190 [Deltaproteobacteria bacterium]|nr:hypothetical protein [Deltaproteobacteria bacterium]